MVLRLGTYNSEEVRELQRQINALRQSEAYAHLRLPTLQEDGDYGPATEAAVRIIQRYAQDAALRDAQGQPIMLDGVAGPQTSALIENFILIAESTRLGTRRREEEAAAAPPERLDSLDAFIALLNGLLNPEPNAPDFDDARTAEEAEGARAEYEGGRRESEARAYPDGRREVVRRIVRYPGVSERDAQRLDQLRTDIELANGGRVVEAIAPVRGDIRVTSHFGMRRHPISGEHKHHDGVDLASNDRTIISSMPGIVEFAGNKHDGYGNVIEIIDIYGQRHRYAHLSSITVRLGDQVEQGEPIGVMGATGRARGIHLHYEQLEGKERVDPRFLGRADWEPGQTIPASRNAEMLAENARPAVTPVVMAAASQPNGTTPEGNNNFNLLRALQGLGERLGIV